MERVVVTGIGVASALGCTVDGFWTKLLAGRTGVVRLSDDFANLSSQIGAVVSDLDESAYFDVKERRRISRSSKLAIVAADQAITAAGLNSPDVDPAEVAVIIGSSIGGYSASDPFFRDYYRKGTESALVIPLSMNVGPAANVSIRYGFRGPLMNIDAACASAAHAIGYAYNLIRSGMFSIAVVGGADSPFSVAVMAAWCAMRALSQHNDSPAEACRPFSADRDGLVLGEGAGILILEHEESARRRGRPILAEIKGYGASADSYHLTQPLMDGACQAMQRAIHNAHLQPDQIDYIHAHGTATPFNDKNETAAIKQVFGSRAYDIPVVGTKAALGHAIAASSALETICAILALRDQCLPPTLNHRVPDPDCDLDYVSEGTRRREIHNVLCNAFAFGGSNASLVIGK